MANNNYNHNITITCNATAPQEALKLLNKRQKEIIKDMSLLDQTVAADKKKWDSYKEELSAVQMAIERNKASMEQFRNVMNNLSQATLRQLRQALRKLKNDMANTSDSKALAKMRNDYAAVERQIKIMQGSLKDVEGHLSTLKNKTDAWLQSAIQQQRSLLGSMENTNNAGYKHQLDVLKQLEAEEQRRAAIKTEQAAVNAGVDVRSGTASAAQLQSARQALLARRATLPQGVAGSAEAREIENINALLKQCDEQIAAIEGKAKQVPLTAQQVEQKVALLAKNLKNATPEALRKGLQMAREQLDKMALSSPQRQKMVQWARELENALKGVDREAGMSKTRFEEITGSIRGLRSANLKELQEAAAKLNNELQTTKRRSEEFYSKQRQLQSIRAEINRTTGAISKQGSAFQTTLRNLTTYFGLFQIFSKISQMLTDVFKKNLEMSDQLSQIRMVSGLAIKDVNRLSDALKGIDTRTSLSGLQQIAYEGSKLGMGQYGVEGLKGFTEAANELNVALKEQMGDDTLTAMSKMVENMGLIKSMGVEKALKATGSAIFSLSASSTSSAGNIVEFTKRLYAMAKSAHITTPELLALGSASDAFGLMPEVASTAMNKFITQIQRVPGAIEQAIKVPKGTVDNLYRSGKTMEAIILILQRMHDMGRARVNVFKALGSDGARMNLVFNSMAENVGAVEQHLRVANKSFKEGTAVSQEYQLRQQTAMGYLERANNLWAKSFINKDGVDVMKQLTMQWYNLSRAITSSTVAMVPFRTVVGGVINGAKLLVVLLPEILTFLGAAGLTRVIIELAAVFSRLRAILVASTISVAALRTAWAGLSVAMRANVIGLVAAVIVGVAIPAYEKLKETLWGTDEAQRKYNNSVSAMKVRLSAAKAEVDGYRRAIDRAAKGSQERVAAIQQFNSVYGSYLSNLLSEKATATDVAKAYERVCTALQNKIALEAKQKDVDKYLTPRYGWSASKLMGLTQATAGTRYAPYGGDVAKAYADDAYKRGIPYQTAVRNYMKKMGLSLTSDELSLLFETAGATDRQIGKYLQNKYGDGGMLRRSIILNGGVKGGRRRVMNIGRSVVDFFSQQYSTNRTSATIDKKWNPYIIPTPFVRDQEAPTPDTGGHGGGGGRGGHTGNSPAEQLSIAKKAAEGLIAEINSYYNNQEAAIEDMVSDGTVTAERAKMINSELKEKRETALMEARLAIAGKNNHWDDFKNNAMGEYHDLADMGRMSEELSRELLQQIVKADTDNIRKMLSALEGGHDVLRDVLKNATQNQYNINKIKADRKEKAVQMMYQYDYTRTYLEDVQNQMIQAGYGTTLDDNFFKAPPKPLHDESEADYKAGGNMKTGVNLGEVSVQGKYLSPYEQMMQQYIAKSPEYLKFNPNNDLDLYKFLQTFASNGNVDKDGDAIALTSWAKKFKPMKDWISALGTEGYDANDQQSMEDLKNRMTPIRDEIRAFFNFLFDADGRYYTEVVEKQQQRAQKIIDSRWEHGEDYEVSQQQHRALSEQANLDSLFGAKHSFWTPFGFARTIRNDDTGVAQAQLDVSDAQKQLDIAKLQTTDPKVLADYVKKLDEATQKLEQTVAERVNTRIDSLRQWTDPIEQLGTAMGNAFATMAQNAKDGRDAVKAALADMVKSYAQSTIKIINQLMMEKVKEALIRKTYGKKAVKTEKQTNEEIADAQKGGSKKKSSLLTKAFKGFIGLFKKHKKESVKTTQETQTELTETEKKGGEARQVLTTGIAQKTTETLGEIQTEATKTKKANVQEDVQTDSASAQASTTLGIASGASKIIGRLGWWGIPLVAVITALLNGLLAWAMSRVSSLFGGGSKGSDSTVNTKLVSGMLTYDSGNVQSFGGQQGTQYVVGNDGRVYRTEHVDNLSTGLVTEPIDTFVGGQRAIVGEHGPEMVIGRETTAALQMNRPDLLRALVSYDKNYSGRGYRAYDGGNVQDFATADNTTLNERLDRIDATNRALTEVLAALQKNGIKATVNKYGRGGIATQAQDGANFMRRNSGDTLWHK
jgi:hypothetical protein